MENLKITPFTKYHIAAGAKMAPFAGYNMPIEFTGINAEHLWVREAVGVFDVSHMGEIWVKGPKAVEFLQHITTNNVATLTDGKVQYSCMPNGQGGIVDDLLVYRVDEQTYLLVVNAANTDKDWAHICAEGAAYGLEAGHGKQLYNASDEICQLAIQGPLALKMVQKMCDEPIEDMPYYTFKKLKGKGRLKEEDVKDAMREIRLALLEADVDAVVLGELAVAVGGAVQVEAGVEVVSELDAASSLELLVHLLGDGVRDLLRRARLDSCDEATVDGPFDDGRERHGLLAVHDCGHVHREAGDAVL